MAAGVHGPATRASPLEGPLSDAAPLPCCAMLRHAAPCCAALRRANKRVVEERIDPVLVLAMRNMYQSAVRAQHACMAMAMHGCMKPAKCATCTGAQCGLYLGMGLGMRNMYQSVVRAQRVHGHGHVIHHCCMEVAIRNMCKAGVCMCLHAYIHTHARKRRWGG